MLCFCHSTIFLRTTVAQFRGLDYATLTYLAVYKTGESMGGALSSTAASQLCGPRFDPEFGLLSV